MPLIKYILLDRGHSLIIYPWTVDTHEIYTPGQWSLIKYILLDSGHSLIIYSWTVDTHEIYIPLDSGHS